MTDPKQSAGHGARGRIGVAWGVFVNAEGCLEALEANECALRSRGEFTRAREYRRMIERYAREWTSSN